LGKYLGEKIQLETGLLDWKNERQFVIGSHENVQTFRRPERIILMVEGTEKKINVGDYKAALLKQLRYLRKCHCERKHGA
jgi:hypothetical protein